MPHKSIQSYLLNHNIYQALEGPWAYDKSGYVGSYRMQTSKITAIFVVGAPPPKK